MLTIRLRRTGAKKDPHFRVVVADSRTGRDGPFIQILGHYHPRRDPAEFSIDREATESWVDKGAQLSDTVRTLIRQLDAGKIREPAGPGRPEAAPEEDASEAAAGKTESEPAEDEPDKKASKKDEKTDAEEKKAAGAETEAEPAEEAEADDAGSDDEEE